MDIFTMDDAYELRECLASLDVPLFVADEDDCFSVEDLKLLVGIITEILKNKKG